MHTDTPSTFHPASKSMVEQTEETDWIQLARVRATDKFSWMTEDIASVVVQYLQEYRLAYLKSLADDRDITGNGDLEDGMGWVDSESSTADQIDQYEHVLSSEELCFREPWKVYSWYWDEDEFRDKGDC